MARLTQLGRKPLIHKGSPMQQGCQGREHLAIAHGVLAAQGLHPLLLQRLQTQGIGAGIEHGDHLQGALAQALAQPLHQVEHRAIGQIVGATEQHRPFLGKRQGQQRPDRIGPPVNAPVHQQRQAQQIGGAGAGHHRDTLQAWFKGGDLLRNAPANV